MRIEIRASAAQSNRCIKFDKRSQLFSARTMKRWSTQRGGVGRGNGLGRSWSRKLCGRVASQVNQYRYKHILTVALQTEHTLVR